MLRQGVYMSTPQSRQCLCLIDDPDSPHICKLCRITILLRMLSFRGHRKASLKISTPSLSSCCDQAFHPGSARPRVCSRLEVVSKYLFSCSKRFNYVKTILLFVIVIDLIALKYKGFPFKDVYCKIQVLFNQQNSHKSRHRAIISPCSCAW
jgi:hypothetical protein